MITGEERLREFLTDLYFGVVFYEGRPSAMQVQRTDALKRELADVVAEFDAWTAQGARRHQRGADVEGPAEDRAAAARGVGEGGRGGRRAERTGRASRGTEASSGTDSGADVLAVANMSGRPHRIRTTVPFGPTPQPARGPANAAALSGVSSMRVHVRPRSVLRAEPVGPTATSSPLVSGTRRTAE